MADGADGEISACGRVDVAEEGMKLKRKGVELAAQRRGQERFR